MPHLTAPPAASYSPRQPEQPPTADDGSAAAVTAEQSYSCPASGDSSANTTGLAAG